MFSVAARYSSLATKEKAERAKYWGSGDDFAESAKKMLAQEDGSSRLTTVQALLLLSYREMGTRQFFISRPVTLVTDSLESCGRNRTKCTRME
jgi:hypothetical protein